MRYKDDPSVTSYEENIITGPSYCDLPCETCSAIIKHCVISEVLFAVWAVFQNVIQIFPKKLCKDVPLKTLKCVNTFSELPRIPFKTRTVDAPVTGCI